MPWAKVVFDIDGNLTIIESKVYTKIECKQKLLILKWDSLEKHVGKGKMNKGESCGS
jgi:hypothetical protein